MIESPIFSINTPAEELHAEPRRHRAIPLDQRYANDVCAMLAQRSGGPVALHAGDTTDLDRLTARFAGLPTIGLAEVQASPVPLVVWYQPLAAQETASVRELRTALAEHGHLVVIGSGMLGRRKSAPAPANIANRLQQAGLRVVQRFSFGNPLSMALGVAGAHLESRGHLAPADRLHFAMRATYAGPGWLARLSARYVLVARI